MVETNYESIPFDGRFDFLLHALVEINSSTINPPSIESTFTDGSLFDSPENFEKTDLYKLVIGPFLNYRPYYRVLYEKAFTENISLENQKKIFQLIILIAGRRVFFGGETEKIFQLIMASHDALKYREYRVLGIGDRCDYYSNNKIIAIFMERDEITGQEGEDQEYPFWMNFDLVFMSLINKVGNEYGDVIINNFAYYLQQSADQAYKQMLVIHRDLENLGSDKISYCVYRNGGDEFTVVGEMPKKYMNNFETLLINYLSQKLEDLIVAYDLSDFDVGNIISQHISATTDNPAVLKVLNRKKAKLLLRPLAFRYEGGKRISPVDFKLPDSEINMVKKDFFEMVKIPFFTKIVLGYNCLPTEEDIRQNFNYYYEEYLASLEPYDFNIFNNFFKSKLTTDSTRQQKEYLVKKFIIFVGRKLKSNNEGVTDANIPELIKDYTRPDYETDLCQIQDTEKKLEEAGIFPGIGPKGSKDEEGVLISDVYQENFIRGRFNPTLGLAPAPRGLLEKLQEEGRIVKSAAVELKIKPANYFSQMLGNVHINQCCNAIFELLEIPKDDPNILVTFTRGVFVIAVVTNNDGRENEKIIQKLSEKLEKLKDFNEFPITYLGKKIYYPCASIISYEDGKGSVIPEDSDFGQLSEINLLRIMIRKLIINNEIENNSCYSNFNPPSDENFDLQILQGLEFNSRSKTYILSILNSVNWCLDNFDRAYEEYFKNLGFIILERDDYKKKVKIYLRLLRMTFEKMKKNAEESYQKKISELRKGS